MIKNNDNVRRKLKYSIIQSIHDNINDKNIYYEVLHTIHHKTYKIHDRSLYKIIKNKMVNYDY